MTADILPVVIGAGLFVGLAKGGLGGLGGLITPLMILAMPDTPQQAVGLVLLMLIVGDWFALYAYWGQWEGWRMKLLLLGAVVGIVIGTTLLADLPTGTVKKLVGVIGLLMAAYTIIEARLSRLAYSPKSWHATVAGGITGFTSSLANAGGPPFSAYMLLQGVKPRNFVATGVLFFAVVNLIKVPFFLHYGTLRFDLLPLALPGMLLVPVGVWAGKKIIDHISRRFFDNLMLLGLVVSSLMLLVR